MTRKPNNKKPDRNRRKPGRCARRPAWPFYRTVSLPAPAAGPETLEATDDAITVIRTLMADLLKGRPDALRLFLQSNDSLVRTIAAEHRRAAKNTRNTAANFLAVLNHLGNEFGQPPTILPPDNP